MREEVHLGLCVPQKFLFGQEIVEHLPGRRRLWVKSLVPPADMHIYSNSILDYASLCSYVLFFHSLQDCLQVLQGPGGSPKLRFSVYLKLSFHFIPSVFKWGWPGCLWALSGHRYTCWYLL